MTKTLLLYGLIGFLTIGPACAEDLEDRVPMPFLGEWMLQAPEGVTPGRFEGERLRLRKDQIDLARYRCDMAPDFWNGPGSVIVSLLYGYGEACALQEGGLALTSLNIYRYDTDEAGRIDIYLHDPALERPWVHETYFLVPARPMAIIEPVFEIPRAFRGNWWVGGALYGTDSLPLSPLESPVGARLKVTGDSVFWRGERCTLEGLDLSASRGVWGQLDLTAETHLPVGLQYRYDETMTLRVSCPVTREERTWLDDPANGGCSAPDHRITLQVSFGPAGIVRLITPVGRGSFLME